MPAKKAVQKPEIVKPLTTVETSIKTKALMTSKKRPIVKAVSGSVSKMRMGFTIALAKPNTRAATMRAAAPANAMPSTPKLETHRERAVGHKKKKKGRRFGMTKCFLKKYAFDLTSRGRLNSRPGALKSQFY